MELGDGSAISGFLGPLTAGGLVPLAPKKAPVWSPTRLEREKTAVMLLKNPVFSCS
jgi:hypothetical protein